MKKLKTQSLLISCAALLFLNGCSHSSIDDKKKAMPRGDSPSRSAPSAQLTDKDIFGNETTLAVSEEDIQAALEGDGFRVPLHSPVILVQSGSRAPDAFMQQEMSKYYSVATFSGIPDRQKPVSCNRNSDEENSIVENMNWMQALRYVAAKGHQKAIIVYHDTLQAGRYHSASKSIVWSDYKNEKLTDGTSLRYLVRFSLIDVATGEWATWTPANGEFTILPPDAGGNQPADMTEQHLAELKQHAWASVVKDLVQRYQ